MRIATLNFYDIPLSFRNKQKDFKIIEEYFLNNDVDLFFLQELNFLKPKSNQLYIYNLPGIISRSGGLCILSKVALNIKFRPFSKQRISSSFMTIGDSILSKGFQYFELNGVMFINTHLASTYKNTYDENMLVTDQVIELQQFINEISKPLIISGDFNLPPNHPSISNFIKDE